MSSKGKEKVIDPVSITEVGEPSSRWENYKELISEAKNWGDVAEEESEDERGDLNHNEIEEEVELEKIDLNEGIVSKEDELKSFLSEKEQNCDCFDDKSCWNMLCCLKDMVEKDPNLENYICICNNIIRTYNLIFCKEKVNKPYSKYKVYFCDLFYRVRHEILFKILCKAINLESAKSDIPFTEFGVESHRTPDKIEIKDGKIIIIEVTATSSIEKAATSKGMEKMGFDSKYKKEIDQLIDLGKEAIYCPVFFNMSDLYNPILREQMEELFKIFGKNLHMYSLLKIVSKHFSYISINFKETLSLPSMILFLDLHTIEAKHNGHKFLYKKAEDESLYKKRKIEYSEITVSNFVFRKITDNWDRLQDIALKSNMKENVKFRFVIDSNGYKIEVNKDKNGLDLEELSECLRTSDKIRVFNNVYIKTLNKNILCTDSETGVKMVDRSKSRPTKTPQELQIISGHTSRIWKKLQNKDQADLIKMSEKCKVFKNEEIVCNFYDYEYEDLIIKSIINLDETHNLGGGGVEDMEARCDIDFGKKLLGQMPANCSAVKSELKKIRGEYLSLNKEGDSLPRVLQKSKSPFILPMGSFNASSYCPLDYKNKNFIYEILNNIREGNDYTSLILNKVLEDSYRMFTDKKVVTDSLQSLINQRSEVSSEINRIYKKIKKDNPDFRNFRSWNESTSKYKGEFETQKLKFNKLRKEIGIRERNEGIGKDISYLRISTGNKKSIHYSAFRSEMDHFKSKKVQSTIEGVGIINNIEADYAKDFEIFSTLGEFLMLNAGNNPDILYDEFVSQDSNLLYELKNKSVEIYKDNKKFFENSKLGHSCSFISRLGHSLMFYSQQSFSSDYIRVDNLGYSNVLLIVKGGKKIFKSKASKLFRLILPIPDCLIQWYQAHPHSKSSSIIFEDQGQSYLISPWTFLHENVLSDSISFYQRVGSFVILNTNPNVPLSEQFIKVQLNVLLSFHNKRKTEVLLANLRYILLSTMGDYTGLHEILNEFFGFNYDCLQSYIRNSIMINYYDYFESLFKLKKASADKEITESNLKNSNLQNIFTNKSIECVEDLALMIYSTFLMTKAPYQKLIERSNNLKGILEIHSYYSENVGLNLTPEEQFNKLNVSCNGDFIDYSKKLFNNDFNFDAKYCALIGGFMDSYFKNNFEVDFFHSEWIRIQNSNWDEMATSTGLRGDYKTVEDFWGQKGYFVVYKKLLKEDDFRNALYTLFNSDLTDGEKRKILKGMNRVYKEPTEGCEFLIFHAVDKSQWRGNREIYVMDIHTKILQQPIEKFMGYVCAKIDNELISVPSNKRAQVIHHSIFEKDIPLKQMLTWYMTLDCSKWAPKSIFSKFSVCINNMSCIPNSFKIHLMNYFEKLYKKRLYFNEKEVEVLKNNVMYKEICDSFLVKDEKVKGYYLEANYSWVMGIFNYMSSFLHAANQKYFSYILQKTTRMSYGEDCNITMYAHSDDSGGRVMVSSPQQLQRSLILYEINMHAANHLISKKKSVVSRIYFEILSVIYLFKKLLALLPKFLGGLRFLPSDKGPCQDILQSYSKCIEVIVAGADFSVAYIVLKIMSYLIFRFYFNKSPEPLDYDRPGQFMGMPDAHPIMCLLCGTDADILRIMSSERGEEKILNQLTFVNCICNDLDGEGPIKPLKFNVKVKNLSKDFELYLQFFSNILDNWSIKNVNYHNTGMNTLNFLTKLNDPGFIGSLVNESQVRRISRSYYHRSGNTLITRFGNIRLRPFIQGLKLFSIFRDKDEAILEILKYSLTEAEIVKITQESEISFLRSEINFKIFKKTMKSPLKILFYFDKLSLKNRQIVNTNRTLKPSLVQLTKGGQIFSVDFDPSVLVSFIKEPSLRWALNNVKNINTAALELNVYLESLGETVSGLSYDILLRICRSFGRDNVKNIYIYSRIPSEMRQIKTYMSFITFLSVNSFNNKEIEGLTINVNDKNSSRDYVTSRISDESYFINNLLSVLFMFIKKCKLDFLEKITFNKIMDIDFLGGNMNELLECLEDRMQGDIETPFYYLQFGILKSLFISGKFRIPKLSKCCFYTFLKEQKSKTGWYGTGEIYINVCSNYYSFKIKNNTVIELLTNKIGKIDQTHEKYILDVFDNTGLILPKTKPKFTESKKYVFGYDFAGGLGVFSNREISRGIPSNYSEHRGGQTSEFEFFQIDIVHKDFIILRDLNNARTFKIYFLPLKKAELVNVIRLIFNPKDFEEKLFLEGLNDFEDYIMTEILPEYGAELSVNFEQFIDMFQASQIYEIIKKCKDLSLTSLNRDLKVSRIPAQEGSLSRVLIDYSIETGDEVVKIYKRIDPDIMRLRSEYPEQVTVIVQDQLQKNYENLYTKKEIKEIEDSYTEMVCSQDLDKKRSELIKLMTFWGYPGLVNNIETFRLLKSPENYMYFNWLNCWEKNPSMHSSSYPKLLMTVLDVMSEFYVKLDPDFYPSKEVSNLFNVFKFNQEYIKNICYECFSVEMTMNHNSLHCIFLNNLLMNLFTDSDFTASLQYKLKDNYIYNSLPIKEEFKNEFLVLLNTLHYCWIRSRNVKFKLDPTKLNIRYPDEIVTPSSLAKEFDISFKSSQIYYCGFLDTDLLNYILANKNIKVKDKNYHITNKIKKLSNVEVPINEIIFAERPLNEEFLESEQWDDIATECQMSELDEDTILEYWNEVEDKYVKKKTKIARRGSDRIVIAQIDWVPLPYLSNKYNITKFIRQVGENVILLTDCEIGGLDVLKSVKKRLFKLNKNKNPLIAYCLFQKELNDEGFINNLLGDRAIKLSKELLDKLQVNRIRDSDHIIKNSNKLGVKIDEKIMLGNLLRVVTEDKVEYIDPNIIQEKKKKKGGSGEEEEESLEASIKTRVGGDLDEESLKKVDKIKYLNLKVDEKAAEIGLDDDIKENLKESYLKILNKGLSFEMIFKSIMAKMDLQKINNDFQQGLLGLTDKQHKDSLQNPRFFSGVSTGNLNLRDPIKNKKLKSEIESVYPGISKLIMSFELKITKKRLKILESNYKLWTRSLKSGTYKIEQKVFLLQLIILIIKSADLSSDSKHEPIWQEIIDNVTVYIAQDVPESEDEITALFENLFITEPCARIKYRTKGI